MKYCVCTEVHLVSRFSFFSGCYKFSAWNLESSVLTSGLNVWKWKQLLGQISQQVFKNNLWSWSNSM